ncbi:GTPase HflX [Gudongella sp. DL1XJH-153]|uniref:GTPase HflX n=1 Tax=Gudongella sp. DL1XJH-153 TaxID=3409804 RepID=UPI003BB6D3A9
MEENKEKVLLVGIELDRDKIDIDDSLDELEELVKAAGGEVLARIIQKKDKINAAYFIGTGKAKEIQEYCEDLEIDTVIFNDELSGAQLRNLEEIIDRKVIDRTTLILDIFALRAVSKEGKLQVKLAQLKYRLPRLVGFSDYLSREGAGIGTRGPGEQKLETDRRHILREINNIEKQLKDIEGVRDVKRKKRISSQMPMVALVGYTNAGKSTLMNELMSEKDGTGDNKKVYVEDMLFASLDTAHRIGKLPNGQDYLLADTVGFVSKLPTKLVEAFKGTLEEVEYADLLLHVVDASNKDLDIQINTTMDLLKDLETVDKPIITVFNKIDKLDIYKVNTSGRDTDNPIYISAKKGTGVEELKKLIQETLPMEYRKVRMLIPFEKQSVSSYFMNQYQVDEIEYTEEGTIFVLTINHIDFQKYNQYIVK